MTVSTSQYEPQKTVSLINDFASPQNKTYRILYSEINSYLTSLDDERTSAFYSNAESLLLHAVNAINTENDIDVVKIVFKIYDHVQLINSQITNMEKVVTPHVDEVKKRLKKRFNNDLKNLEREYITILGIFAAIILAFVGSFTFSTSVLNNIDKIPFVRLLIVVCTLWLAFYKMMLLLVNFLREINDKQSSPHPSKKNIIHFLIIFSFIFGAGMFIGINYWDNIRTILINMINVKL
ncbi:MAG: hypothetical protein IJQ99_03045 [Synergistaceae bacterium]|nr:hypothetical protein [Synergistaceae bacterium]